MAVTNGSVVISAAERARPRLRISWLLALMLLAAPCTATTTATAASQVPQDASGPQDLERLRRMLAQAGPEGREARETAVVRLLEMSDPAAHRTLHEYLRRTDDPDRVRSAILQALQSHVLANSRTWFGGVSDEQRRQILAGYLAALAPLWSDAGQPLDDATANPVRAAARIALQRVPVRELDVAARLLLASSDSQVKVLVLRCLADMQQVLLTQTLADFLDSPDEAVQAQARRSLQLLTCHEDLFTSRAQFDAWFERFGGTRYVDLAERAARLGPRPLELMREELARMRVDAAREFVRAYTKRTAGVDWAAVQGRTIVDDPAVLDACLEELQQSLADGLPTDDQPAPRQVFCRALVQRFRQASPERTRRRALLLEVAAYLVRSDESDLASELTTLLLAQLDSQDVDVQVSALRGLRRFPNPENRARLVRFAGAMLERMPDTRPQLLATLGTLSSRAAPRWNAPRAQDVDLQEWAGLVGRVCRSSDSDVRTAGLSLAQTLDGRDQRVPEMFDVLLDLANDTNQDSKFRSTCLIHLQGWRNQEGVGERWVLAMHSLMKDSVDELRRQAAESLTKLPELFDARRIEWIAATIGVLRDRLKGEQNPTVLRAFLDCLLACGREPQMPEKAIGALNGLLAELGNPVPADQQFRVEPLLQALATIAADQQADRGQWLGACHKLLQFDKRQSLRLVLQSHRAVDLSKDIASPEAGLAERARLAMQFIIKTALLKPAKDGWNSSEELRQEARDVRVAFGALDTIDESHRLDEAPHRLLRLEVEVAGNKYVEVVQRATAWLGNGSGSRMPTTPAQRDRIRVLLAEAQLGLNKPDAAAKSLVEISPQMASDPGVLDLQSRIARSLLNTDRPAAVELLAKTWRATPPEDPTFRQRLLDWFDQQIKLDPASRQVTVEEVEKFAGMFASPDCPAEQRDAFEQLRNPR
jgi:hypothetical protein